MHLSLKTPPDGIKMSRNNVSYATFEHYNGNPEEDEKVADPYKPIEIQSEQHKKKILSDYAIVTVMIYGTWCGPCKVFKPKYYEFAKGNLAKSYFALEDVDLKLTSDIKAVPSLLVYKKGRLAHVIKGGNLEELNEVLPPI